MIQFVTWGALFLAIALPSSGFAVEKSVTVNWNISDASQVQGYKLYFDYSTPMTANKKLACETYTNPTTTTSITCPQVEIAQFPVYFSVAAVKADGSGEVESALKVVTATISPVQGFVLGTSPPANTSLPSYAINFQPGTSNIPDGYLADTGGAFNDTVGYGWTNSDLYGPRDRDNALSPDQAYDTLNQVRDAAVWEISLPNGSYSLTVCVGDPSYPNGTHDVQAEGVPIINHEDLSSSQLWIERTQDIEVTDSRLTLTFNNVPVYTKLCWIKITPN